MNKKSSMMFLKDLFIIADLEKKIVLRSKSIVCFLMCLSTDDHSNLSREISREKCRITADGYDGFMYQTKIIMQDKERQNNTI
jgi:hypothetical protein